MSKKSRRERTPNLPPEAFNVPPAPKSVPSAGAEDGITLTPAANATNSRRQAATTSTSTSGAATPIDWKAEYGEVIGDLRRTFIIFAGLVVVMIALSFVIR
jgi:hypothetical protein